MKKIKQLLEKIAADIMLLEKDDLQGMVSLMTLFEEISALCSKKKLNEGVLIANESASLLGDIIKADSKTPEEDFKKVKNNISRLQRISPDKNDSPAPIPEVETTESTPQEKELDTGTDDKILKDFLEKLVSVLDRIEVLSLSLEKKSSDEEFNELLRLIHTLKGEAGFLNLKEIEVTAHALETSLQNSGKKISCETMLTYKDWLSNASAQIQAGKQPEDTQKMLDIIKQPTPLTPPKKQPAPPPKAETQLMDDPAFITDFITESREHLESAENAILKYEKGEKSDNMNCIFRAFHTIKGIAGFLHLEDICEITHEAENLFDKLRNNKMSFNQGIMDLCLRVIDKVKNLVFSVEKSLNEKCPLKRDLEVSEIVDLLQRCQNGENLSPEVSKEALPEPPRETASDSQPKSATVQEEDSIRIHTEKLDNLINMVGELVIVQAMVNQLAVQYHDPVFMKNLDLMKKITRSLQEASMTLRLVPLKGTFLKMTRVLRDVSKKRGKKAELVISGEDTELDKTVVDKINDPLVHMLRNAVDHGIEETPEERIKAGKSETGRIELRAFHKGGNIHIEIEDDGKGLNKEAILKKAIDKGMLKEGQSLSEREIYNFIFEPGFSTAKVITEVSGRGVGMDVVKKNIEMLRGQIEIQSTPGKGTIFSIRLPLTLAIIEGMIIRVGSEKYILPTLSIINSFRPEKEKISSVLGKGELIRFQDKLLPLMRLKNIFSRKNGHDDACQALIVIIENDGKLAGLLVDELLGQQEIVIKTLGEVFGDTNGISGGAILPDGSVGLILDVAGLIKMAEEKCSPPSLEAPELFSTENPSTLNGRAES